MGDLWTFLMAGLAGVVWLLRLESRIKSHEDVCLERQRQAADARQQTRESLQRIESRIELLSDRLGSNHGT